MKNKGNQEAEINARRSNGPLEDGSATNSAVLLQEVPKSVAGTVERSQKAIILAAKSDQRNSTSELLRQSRVSEEVLKVIIDEEDSVFTDAQNAFADPSDHLTPTRKLTAAENTESLKYLIINPARIPDAVFLQLTGFSRTGWKKLTTLEQLVQKRKILSEFKELLVGMVELANRAKSSVMRVMRMPEHRGFPKAAGKYLVFIPQEKTSAGAWAKNIEVLFFPDISEVIVFQTGIMQSLQKKRTLLKTAHENLMQLRLNYHSESLDRKTEVQTFMETYFGEYAEGFKRDLDSFVKGLQYKNNVKDHAALTQMCGCIERQWKQTEQKYAQISQQQALLIGSMRNHTNNFFLFLSTFFLPLSSINSFDLNEKLERGWLLHAQFTPGEKNLMKKIWTAVNSRIDPTRESPLIGAPFFGIEKSILESKKITGNVPVEDIRALFPLVIQAKQSAYSIVLHYLEHGILTGDYLEQLRLGGNSNKYADRIRQVITTLDSPHLFKDVKVPWVKENEFEKKLAHLKEVLSLMIPGKEEELLKAVKFYLWKSGVVRANVIQEKTVRLTEENAFEDSGSLKE